MIELYPELVTLTRTRFSPALEHDQITLIFDHHIVRFAEVALVNHDVAGNHQTSATISPATIKPHQFFGGVIVDRA